MDADRRRVDGNTASSGPRTRSALWASHSRPRTPKATGRISEDEAAREPDSVACVSPQALARTASRRLTCGAWGPLKGRQEGSASDHAGAPQGAAVGLRSGLKPVAGEGGAQRRSRPCGCALVRGLWTSLNREEQQAVSLSVGRFAISVPSDKYQGSAREKGKWEVRGPTGSGTVSPKDSGVPGSGRKSQLL